MASLIASMKSIAPAVPVYPFARVLASLVVAVDPLQQLVVFTVRAAAIRRAARRRRRIATTIVHALVSDLGHLCERGRSACEHEQQDEIPHGQPPVSVVSSHDARLRISLSRKWIYRADARPSATIALA